MSEPSDESAELASIEARLEVIDAALRRLDDGTYARCDSCGRAIEDERLATEPAARWCASCARAASGGG
ncbi:MAG: TraR/DksA C4-type zinc finger protein [Acidimicrobiales bacterium]